MPFESVRVCLWGSSYRRLQQKTVAPAVLVESQLHVQRQGRLQVGKRLLHQGNSVEPLGHQTLEFQFSHHVREHLKIDLSYPSNCKGVDHRGLVQSGWF